MRTSETDPHTPEVAHSLIGVTPIKDNVIIETMSVPEMIGSLYTPEVARKEIQAGRVVAVGPGVRFPDGTLIPPQVGVGELVLYTGAWQGEEFSREGRQYRVLENLQIAAALPPDANEITIRHLFQ